MPKIAPHRSREILDILEQSFFTAAGYEVSENPGSNLIVLISLKGYGDQFSIKLEQITDQKSFTDTASRTFLLSTETPGDYIQNQRTELSSFEGFLTRLRAWCDRVKKEIVRKDGIQSQLFKLREELDERFGQHIKDGDAHFTDDEKANLFAQLDQLSEKLDESFAQHKTQKAETERLHEIISEMKLAAEAMLKKTWYRTLFNKISVFFSSETGKTLIDASIKLLGPPTNG